jgi:hypothetical protein
MNFPDVSAAFMEWTETLVFYPLRKTQSDGETVETQIIPVIFAGNLQPMPERKVLLKPEGERLWKWWELLSKQYIPLDSVVKDRQSKSYRVMDVKDWHQAGYYWYQLTEGPVPA